ncbi:Ankyrin repeats (many copies) [Phytophthora infestans]|uniref:Ankyrin repeats (Many copies) n=1 Tax=Phytophthora infestans TaxID=4787 RepID=A0A8S9UBP4_PHYIN|nr:Ankyrin repeats (many copies) [Phytophthora infestans]KAF4141822.1 Ankyrin repeats (many copies) [Phytophthora infestans]
MTSLSRRTSKTSIAEREATLTAGLAVILHEQPRVAALQHVMYALDDLVDISWQWNIARACALESHDMCSDDGGARRLVARLVARWPLEDMDTFYRQAQLSVGLVNAAQRGNTKLVRWLLGNIVSERFTVDSRSGIFKAVEAAATVGHLNILEQVLVYDKRGVCIKPAMVSAARGSKLDALKWLHKRLVRPVELSDCAGSLLEAAAGSGNTEITSWVVDTVGADSVRLSVASAAQSAISRGHLEVIEYLAGVVSSIDGPLSLDEAAGEGHLQAVRWGFEHGGACTTQAIDAAAGHGHLEIVQWLHRYRTDGCTTLAFDNAASHSHMDVIQWLHENRGEGCTTKAMDGAASNGQLDVVKWLHKNRREGCTAAAMNGAARGNHLDVLQWLYDHRTEGCTQDAVNEAASHGNVAVMR